ncbi:MAG TPA: hypothetical protein VFV93_11370 [Thermomicrobiales bacterium]|nr:hypothetical protein [Thermomicrobiales bacterium]
MSALKWILTLPLRAIRYPFRLYRRKISVQLIVSHILVVFLSIVLLEAALIGIAIAIFQNLEDDAFTEYSIATTRHHPRSCWRRIRRSERSRPTPGRLRWTSNND